MAEIMRAGLDNEPKSLPDGSHYIEPPGGPRVRELQPHAEEPPIWPEPPKRPVDFEEIGITIMGYDDKTKAYNVQFHGGFPPYLVSWGDGTQLGDVWPGAYRHTYEGYGPYTITASDCDVPPSVVTEVVTAEEPVEESPLSEGKRDWENFTTHAQFADYWDDNELGEEPDGWDTMTIAKKKAWMDENIEP